MSGREPTVADAPYAFTSPHFLATRAGINVLERGGSAVDAMVAAAAMIAVAYPHMNGLGGDSFWLVHQPGHAPWAIDASGNAATAASVKWYAERGHAAIPGRGPAAALTMAGTVAGWQLARDTALKNAPTSSNLPIQELLAPAIEQTQTGITVTESLAAASSKVAAELKGAAEYQQLFTREGQPLEAGEVLRNPGLGRLLTQLGEKGLTDFYRGEVGRTLGAYLQQCGSPLAVEDFSAYQAQVVRPLVASIRGGQVFNLPAPTQGFASLMLLACYDRLAQPHWSEADAIHAIIEITKYAFNRREQWIGDPSCVPVDLSAQLSDQALEQAAAEIDLEQVAPWPNYAPGGDTVWMGARDSNGTMVSFIQSLYWEFGSGVVVPEYGLVWNNRGSSFTLEQGIRQLAPQRKPFHTLNPALLLQDSGSRIAYGTMGGEGQPQTQAAMMMRHLYMGESLARSVSKPRWLLGRTWGDADDGLKIESDLDPAVLTELAHRGHDITLVPAKSEAMGHAGMVKDNAQGSIEAATDPRSDGLALVAG